MKMTPGKSNGSVAKEPAAFRLSRSRVAKKRRVLFETKDFWRAISSAALSSPHTPVLRRLHD
jgi:hypothetical protein